MFLSQRVTKSLFSSFRIDDNDDRRISKDEFVAPEIKAAVEKVNGTPGTNFRSDQTA